MLPKEKKENEVKSNTNIMLKLNSSFESDKQRKTKENCNNDERKRESSEKFSLKSNATTKSFKSTRKKEDSSGQFSSSHLSSQFAENKVPLNDVLRFLPRRDGNKTDSISGHCEETGVQETGNITGSREPVLVRETRTSRLRAASKTPISDTDSSSLKSAIDSKKPLKEVS